MVSALSTKCRHPAIGFALALLGFYLSPNARAEMADIPVPLVTIEAGQKIEKSELASKSYYVSDVAARLFATAEAQVEGKVAKRALLVGKPISLSYLLTSGAVSQGAPTKSTLQRNGLVITTILIPVQSGFSGQIIDARNPESGRIIRAIVNTDGTLRISGS